MKQIFTAILLISIFGLFSLQAQDLNIKEIGQNQYVVHTVTSGESLSQISLIYDVSIDEILETNTHIKNEDDIKANDILMIPYGKVSQASMGEEGTTVHTVQKGENLFRISQEYGTTIDEIKNWNGLKDDKIKMGQELIVGVSNRKSTRKNNKKQSNYAQRTNRADGELIDDLFHEVVKGETLSSISRLYGVSVADLKEWNDLSSDLIEVEQLLQVVPDDESESEDELDDEDYGDAILESDDKSAAIDVEYYKVRKGDNLNRIGERYGVHPNQLKELNNLQDANDIYVDQQLIIKKKGIAVESHPKSKIILYTVELDDKIEVLAESFDVSVENIRYWNNLGSEDILTKGQQLKIRATPETATSYTTIIEADEDLNASNLNDIQQISKNRVLTYGGLDSDNQGFQVDSSKVKEYKVTILHGENLNKIAEREGVTIAQIVDWNNLEDPNHVEAGQELLLYSGLPKPKTTSNVDPRILAITDNNTAPKIQAIHKVAGGETLSSIASQSQYKGVTIDEILEANDHISHEDSLKRNMELKIPEHRELTPVVQNYDNGTFHLIKSGESLSSIADQYEGVTIDAILKANNFENENAIDRGLVILIPPPNSSEIDLEKIANRQIAIENAKKFDNPYLKEEVKHLLPKGEDAAHDLFRDYAENGPKDFKGVSTGGNNFYNTTGNSDNSQGVNNTSSNPGNNTGNTNTNPYNSNPGNNTGNTNPYNSNPSNDTGNTNTNPYNSNPGNNTGNTNPYNSNPSNDTGNTNPYNAEPGNDNSGEDDAIDNFMRGQPDEANVSGTEGDIQDNSTGDQDDPVVDANDSNTVNNNNSLPGNAKIVQTGYAQLMSVSGTSRKYVGLHRDAPINSVVTVTNPENGRKAYVMIIDRLTDPVDADVVIQVSESTINQLNPGADVNQKVNIELFYNLK